MSVTIPSAESPCPCTSGRAFSACCGPFLTKSSEAPDPVALMRSRYAAFACSEPEYLVRTLHATHEGLEVGEKVLEQRIAIACKKYKYRGLWILDSAPPDAEGTAEVLFFAKVYESGKDKSFVERSKFKHDGTGWRYVDGLLAEKKDLTVDPKALKLKTFAEMVA